MFYVLIVCEFYFKVLECIFFLNRSVIDNEVWKVWYRLFYLVGNFWEVFGIFDYLWYFIDIFVCKKFYFYSELDYFLEII